ncbi:MAG: phytoene/squalene synthase family protein [Calditrichaeota bacterium]|nr:phytoene/squalene synthase family protein [Calditrichota bacterium]MCB9089043.1 phytoene/squalene synthase family protein [Calditrichia bacterium]
MKFWLNHHHKAAFEHARLLTAHFSKSFYISARMLPRETRWATYAVYGFCRYADNLIDNPRHRSRQELLEEAEFLMKELQIAYRTGESEHPIVNPFIIVARKYNIPIEYPMDLLRGVQMDLQNTRYQSFEDLYLFCYRVAGVVGLMMTHVLGYKDPAAFKYAENLGIAMQLTNILRDIQEDKRMGRIYLPLEELQQFGVSEHDIINEHMSENLRQLMKFQVRRAHQYYESSAKGVAMLHRKSQFAIYAASKIYRGILYKIEARHYNPFLGRVFVPQVKKVGILLQEIFRTRVIALPERV